MFAVNFNSQGAFRQQTTNDRALISVTRTADCGLRLKITPLRNSQQLKRIQFWFCNSSATMVPRLATCNEEVQWRN